MNPITIASHNIAAALAGVPWLALLAAAAPVVCLLALLLACIMDGRQTSKAPPVRQPGPFDSHIDHPDAELLHRKHY